MDTSHTARLKGAEALVRGGHLDRAIEELATVADALYAAGRLSEAGPVYTKMLDLSPDDGRALLRSGEIAVAEGRFVAARAYFAAGVDLRLAHGDESGAAGFRARLDRLALVDVESRLDWARNRSGAGVTSGQAPARPVPSAPVPVSHRGSRPASDPGRGANGDFQLRTSLARVFVARGDAIGAAEYLTPEMAGGDPLLLLAIAEIQLRGGKFEDAVALVDRILTDHPSLIHAVSQLGADAAPYAPDAGFEVVEMAVTVWDARSEFHAAANALAEFVAAVPDHTAALIRLSEMNAAAARHRSAERAPDQTVILSFRPQPAAKAKKHA